VIKFKAIQPAIFFDPGTITDKQVFKFRHKSVRAQVAVYGMIPGTVYIRAQSRFQFEERIPDNRFGFKPVGFEMGVGSGVILPFGFALIHQQNPLFSRSPSRRSALKSVS
jgi:hypothetical protein